MCSFREEKVIFLCVAVGCVAGLRGWLGGVGVVDMNAIVCACNFLSSPFFFHI